MCFLVAAASLLGGRDIVCLTGPGSAGTQELKRELSHGAKRTSQSILPPHSHSDELWVINGVLQSLLDSSAEQEHRFCTFVSQMERLCWGKPPIGDKKTSEIKQKQPIKEDNLTHFEQRCCEIDDCFSEQIKSTFMKL